MDSVVSVKLFSERHPSFPQGGLRHLIFNADQNGLAKSGAIIRVGRKVLLDEDKFFEWVKSSAIPGK
jgi:hypothetical protein